VIKLQLQKMVKISSPWWSRHFIYTTYKNNYYTSDSQWKIWLVESIQSFHNGLWTWHDNCNICCRYCMYHVKFNVCLVTKPLGVFSSETKWLNASLLFLRMNYMCKCIIKQLLLNLVFAWYHELSKPRVCVICHSLLFVPRNSEPV